MKRAPHRSAVPSAPKGTAHPRSGVAPEGVLDLRVMATRFVLADCFAVMRVRISPSPDQPLSRLSLNPYDPLAPSSAHDQWHCKALPLPPSVRCASLSTCSPLIRARRAYPTPRLPVKGAGPVACWLLLSRGPDATTPHPGCPEDACLPRPSLKVPPNHTTRIMLCQVVIPGRGHSPRPAPRREDPPAREVFYPTPSTMSSTPPRFGTIQGPLARSGICSTHWHGRRPILPVAR